MDAAAPAAPHHVSVLLAETLAALDPKPGQCVVDATLGAGGHSAAILERIPGGWLIGCDADTSALELARERLAPLAAKHSVRLDLIHSNFSNIQRVLNELQAPAPNAILADIGVSSMQFDDPSRGFSFRSDEKLDMRMDRSAGTATAADILRSSSEEEIADILFHLGEEYKARRIARAIVGIRKTQPVETTGQLEELVRRALRVRGHRRIHPATKTFQALRIAVNHELEELDALLRVAPELLADGGAFGVISFHSLEDRRVKQAFKALCESSRFNQGEKFFRPSAAEEQSNPRSRSAKLRVVYKAA
jgi:16S rRNA (cytosine1402-N4)-methyltransferase